MDTPRVSVVIPTFNRAHMLGTAIESVLAQTFEAFELLIVDDGSIDNTEAVVERYSAIDRRVRYLRQEHRGIGAAMNAGIRATNGAYVARLDSDDIWLPELLMNETAVLDAQPEIGLVYAKGQSMNLDFGPRPDFIGHAPHYPNDAFRSMLWDDCTCNITVVVRRCCFDRAGLFDEMLCASEDWDMWLRVSMHDRFVFVDRVLAGFRNHSGSGTSPQSPHFPDFLEGRPKVLDKLFTLPGLPPAAVEMRPIAYRNLYAHIGLMWVAAGNWRRAAQAFRQAIRVSRRPVSTMARIAFFFVSDRVLSRTAPGRRLLRWQSGLRLRLRERKQLTRACCIM